MGLFDYFKKDKSRKKQIKLYGKTFDIHFDKKGNTNVIVEKNEELEKQNKISAQLREEQTINECKKTEYYRLVQGVYYVFKSASSKPLYDFETFLNDIKSEVEKRNYPFDESVVNEVNTRFNSSIKDSIVFKSFENKGWFLFDNINKNKDVILGVLALGRIDFVSKKIKTLKTDKTINKYKNNLISEIEFIKIHICNNLFKQVEIILKELNY